MKVMWISSLKISYCIVLTLPRVLTWDDKTACVMRLSGVTCGLAQVTTDFPTVVRGRKEHPDNRSEGGSPARRLWLAAGVREAAESEIVEKMGLL